MMSRLTLLAVLLATASASACVHPQIDEQAMRWSNLIAQAKLLEVSERIEMKALAAKPPAGATTRAEAQVSAVYWYRVYSFEVEKVFDSRTVKPKHRIEVVRFFGKVDDPNASATKPPAANAPPDACSQLLTRAAVGKSFVMLLRPEQDIKMHRPPVWNDTKNLDPRDAEVHAIGGYAVIHLIPLEKATDAEMTQLKTVLAQTRAAEKAAEPTIKPEIDKILAARTDADAEPGVAALRHIGYKAVGPIKAARDKKETTPAAKERLAKLAIELSPPPLTIQIADFHE